jgi:DNA-binding NtrC family response regulator
MAGEIVWVIYGHDGVRELFSLNLSEEGYDIREFVRGKDALELLGKGEKPDAVFCEIDTFGRREDAEEFYRSAKPHLGNTPRYMVGYSPSGAITRDDGIRVVPMPIDWEQVTSTLRKDLDEILSQQGSED